MIANTAWKHLHKLLVGLSGGLPRSSSALAATIWYQLIMLTIHHLQRGQSERIVWLCEELGIPYELKNHSRDPSTFLSPPELQKL